MSNPLIVFAKEIRDRYKSWEIVIVGELFRAANNSPDAVDYKHLAFVMFSSREEQEVFVRSRNNIAYVEWSYLLPGRKLETYRAPVSMLEAEPNARGWKEELGLPDDWTRMYDSRILSKL